MARGEGLDAGDPSIPAAIGQSDAVLVRDRAGRPRPLPDGLDIAQHRIATDDYFGRLHTNDRPHIARAWARATSEPGRVHSARGWTLIDDTWVFRHYAYLQVSDDVVLVGVTTIDTGDLEPPGSADPISSETARWSILRIGPNGEVLRAEGTVEALYGRSAAGLIGTNGLDLVHPDDHTRLLDAWAQVVDGDSAGRALRQRVLHTDGSHTWVLASIGRRDPDGAVTIHDLDISSQIRSEEALRASEARFRQLANELPAGVFVADADGSFEFTNPRCEDLLGDAGSLVDLLGTTWSALVDAASRGNDASRDVTRGGSVLRIRCQRPLPDGTVCGVIEDVTSSTRWREEARRDELTGLANRLTITREIRRRVDAGGGSTLAFIDLDGFKRINDEHGHDEGDLVLKRVGAALQGLIRDGDLAGRWGGDEFVIVAGELPPDAQSDLRRRIDAAMITCGAGGASVGFTAIDLEDEVRDVIDRADRAMYADKRSSSR